jgi:hypothetical protein
MNDCKSGTGSRRNKTTTEITNTTNIHEKNFPSNLRLRSRKFFFFIRPACKLECIAAGFVSGPMQAVKYMESAG